jgi:hypothetical protein
MSCLNESSIIIDNWVVTQSTNGDSVSIIPLFFFQIKEEKDKNKKEDKEEKKDKEEKDKEEKKDKVRVEDIPRKNYGSKKMDRNKLSLLAKGIIHYHEL